MSQSLVPQRADPEQYMVGRDLGGNTQKQSCSLNRRVKVEFRRSIGVYTVWICGPRLACPDPSMPFARAIAVQLAMYIASCTAIAQACSPEKVHVESLLVATHWRSPRRGHLVVQAAAEPGSWLLFSSINTTICQKQQESQATADCLCSLPPSR